MYQSVSREACCNPFDWLPALMAQMLNHPAFLMVPSGFSRISVSLRGKLASAPCAEGSRDNAASASTASNAASNQENLGLIGFPPRGSRVMRPVLWAQTLHLAAK